MKSLKVISYYIGVLSILFLATGCDIDEQPLSALSEATFWESEGDADLALTGIYEAGNVGFNGYTNEHLIMASLTDDSMYKFGTVGNIYSGYLNPADGQTVGAIWNRAYQAIFRANYFLENIGGVDMDAQKKAEMTAEARFLRAYEYFYLSVLYGGVPLITETLTIEEANSQTRNSLQEVQNFAISELTDAAEDLPETRPSSEYGKIKRAAALAIKGRLLMIRENWVDAANTYQQIINSNAHSLASDFKSIFIESGQDTDEIILRSRRIAGLYGNTHNQRNYHPEFYGGYQEDNISQRLIDSFLMVDGLPINESPLYDPDNPFDNRDPRLYETAFLPGYTVFRGELWPDDPSTVIGALNGSTGYGWKKFVDEDYSGNIGSSGDDVILVRYAEVLLSYLESRLENGDVITQDLLNQTINQVRARESVDMPPVTETDPELLREIVRNERRVEFATEKLIRYMDIRRWDIFYDVMNTTMYGMRLTDDPDNYDGAYAIETIGEYAGHYRVVDRSGTFPEGRHLMPIPLGEIDINPALEQNPSY